MNPAVIFTALTLFLTCTAVSAGPTEDFQALLDEAWEWQMDEFPVWASRLGDKRANDRWTDESLEAIERRFQDRRAFLVRLRDIDPGSLSEQDKLNYELFRRDLQTDVDANKYRAYLMPMSQRGGVQSLDSTAESVPLSSVKDYDDWLARMDSIDDVIEQTMELQEAGRKEGYMPPKILMGRIPDQIAAQLVENAEESPFYSAFVNLPESFSEEDRERLQATAKTIIDKKIVPAYRDFNRYFVDTYLPASRDSIGASALPNGKAFYEFRTRSYTTTSKTPDEIHRIGLNEVARIRAEMQLIIDELEFDGDFADFLHFLRTDPQFYYDDPQALFDGYLAICKRIDPELVKLFGKLPRMPYGLRAIPASTAPDTTTAYYMSPAADGSRAGYYYVNLYRPDVRPTYEMEVLSVHEAMPGHHLQIALQMELPDMPAFRRYSGFTAFTEGWGLYSESLGYELGAVQGSVLTVRRTHLRNVACGPAGCRHRHALQGMDPATGDRLFQRQRGQDRARYHQRNRSLHFLARTGPCLQDRTAENPRVTRQGGANAG